MQFEYYYNHVPSVGQCRNNLIYTSLISQDKKTFVKWYYNDTEYHRGQNEVVDPALMEEKWLRELKFLDLAITHNKDLVPIVSEIDYKNKKIYFEIDGVDFWQQSIDQGKLPISNWQDQMLSILEAHRNAGFWKFSLHPSSYFVINNQLKSINFFFSYADNEQQIKMSSIMSHISKKRQYELKKYLKKHNIAIDSNTNLNKLGQLALDSFSDSYPIDFIKKAKEIYV